MSDYEENAETKGTRKEQDTNSNKNQTGRTEHLNEIK